MTNADRPANYAVQIGNCNARIHHTGITKREHFAGLAMQGLLASGKVQAEARMAKDAVERADALLAELNKKLAP